MLVPENHSEISWNYFTGSCDPEDYKELAAKVLAGTATKSEETVLAKGVRTYPGLIAGWDLTSLHVPALADRYPDLLCELMTTRTDPADLKTYTEPVKIDRYYSALVNEKFSPSEPQTVMKLNETLEIPHDVFAAIIMKWMLFAAAADKATVRQDMKG